MSDSFMHIGRLELSNGPNNIAGPDQWEASGDSVRFSGVYHPPRYPNEPVQAVRDRGRAFQQQLLGMGSTRPVVPVWYGTDHPHAGYDVRNARGFWLITSARVSEIDNNTQRDGTCRYEIVMARTGSGYSSGRIELFIDWLLRPNNEGVDSSEAVQKLSWPDSLWTSSLRTIVQEETATGPIKSITSTLNGVGSAAPIEELEVFTAPDAFYNGAATIEAQYSPNGPWSPIVGTQVPGDVAPYRVRLSNGLTRVWYRYDPDVTGTSDVQLWWQGFDGTNWGHERYAPINKMPSGVFTETDIPVIVTKETTARVGIEVLLGGDGRRLMVTLDRGDRFAKVTLTPASTPTTLQLITYDVDGATQWPLSLVAYGLGYGDTGVQAADYGDNQLAVVTGPDLAIVIGNAEIAETTGVGNIFGVGCCDLADAVNDVIRHYYVINNVAQQVTG